MTQAQLRLCDIDGGMECLSIPVAQVPMIPRVGETIILHAGSGDPVELEVTGVKHEYRLSSANDVEAASVVLAVKRRKPLEYGLIRAMEEMQAEGR
jgi:hypothetical protein